MTKVSSSQYQNITIDELVTYSIFSLQEDGEEATFEKIVAKCFELFPEKFSLIGYPQWPDSTRVTKSWLRCRTDFKYIKGTVKTGFKLTTKGLVVVERVQKKLRRPVSEKMIVAQKKASERSKEEQFIKQLEKSEIFNKYLLEGENIEISHFEFCDMLYCTMESSAKILKENLEKLKDYSQILNRDRVIDFLQFIENKFSYLLINTLKVKKHSGGMSRKKI